MRAETSRAKLVFGALLLVYLGVLFFVRNGDGSTSDASLSEWERLSLDGRELWLERIRQYATSAAIDALWFFPLGFFCALSWKRRESWLGTLFALTLPAAALTGVLTYAVLGYEPLLSFEPPGPLALAAALTGAMLGVWAGASASRGPLALFAFFPKLVLASFVLLALAAGGVYLATEPVPADIARPQLDIEDRRALVRRFREHNPLRLRNGETRTLTLPPSDLENLAGWAFSILGHVPRFRLDTGPSLITLRCSARLPMVERYLNANMLLSPRVRDGELELDIPSMALGSLSVPAPVLSLVSRAAESEIERRDAARAVIDGIDSVQIDEAGVAIQYGRMDARGDVLARALARLGPDDTVLEAARAQIHRLASSPPGGYGDAGFVATVQSTFAHARERTASSHAVVENAGALLALAAVIGHPRLATFSGLEPERRLVERARSILGPLTLRGRNDWARHFFVSAGLTQLSSVAVSDAAGVLKEELDADMEEGGSGFSFADLMADRAGTRFARAATRDADAARTMQNRLADGFPVEALFPSAEGLGEGISDDVLAARYGGVGGTEYRAVSREIERRLDGCAALR